MASNSASDRASATHSDKNTKHSSSTDSLDIVKAISGDAFDAWHTERQFSENIRNGQHYFNGPPSQQPPTRHSPSKLLQCHRKSYYQHYNAPKETESPDGIFWVGDQIETELAVPFLRDIVGDDRFVRNSVWINLEVTAGGDEIQIRGETDPVIVDRTNTPQLLTEIKSTSSVAHLDTPKQHHKAQTHAYLKGLSEKYDISLTNGMILYIDRESLTMRPFHVEFDPVFWEQITDWAMTQSEYRSQMDLPPGSPEQSWECQYCSYKNRCGQGEYDGEHSPAKGLLPAQEYPKSQLEDYLAAHSGAALTPTTAAQYPDLAANYRVQDWICEHCQSAIPFAAIDWDTTAESLPDCPLCQAENQPARLHAPSLSEQWPLQLAQRTTASEAGTDE